MVQALGKAVWYKSSSTELPDDPTIPLFLLKGFIRNSMNTLQLNYKCSIKTAAGLCPQVRRKRCAGRPPRHILDFI